jgi:hypothetical protein
MVYEAWALGISVVFPDFLIGPAIDRYLAARSAEAKIFRRGIGLHARSFGELLEFCMSSVGLDDKGSTVPGQLS